MKFSDSYMTAEEFCMNVINVARECGYSLDGRHHPEDLAHNLNTVMIAYAAGYTEGVRRMVQR